MELMVVLETPDFPEPRVTPVCQALLRLESRETWVFRDCLDLPDDPEKGEMLEKMA